jgi:glycosidase
MTGPPSRPRRQRGAAGFVVAAGLAVLAGLVWLAGPGAGPARAVTPSPPDWRSLMIYQVLTDRFYNGLPGNDEAEGSYQPAIGNRTHGGDFAGLTAKLDYLQGLGVGAVWISPVYLNAYGEYHGYAARDFYTVSSQFGGLAGLTAFIDAAHARGIYVVIDIVLNHMGDMIDSGTAGYPSYDAPPSPYVLRYRNLTPRPAAPFNNLAWYHNNGHIGAYNDPEQILGELVGLDDLKTDLPAVRDALVTASNWLIDQTDCDGFRIDTVKHVELEFWQYWTPLVRAHAASIGKDDFLMFGEVFDGSDAKNGSYTGTVAGGPYALNSLLYYPMHFSSNDVFVYNQPTSRLTDRYAALTSYDPTVRDRLVTFLDNHDNPRFLAFEKASQDTTKLRVALDWLLTSVEIPCLYYGTEQMFDGGGDPWCREDMWDGEWDYGPSEGDNFNVTHPLYLRVMRLNNWRRLVPALTTGAQTLLQHDTGAPGLYVYRRGSGADAAIVVLNTASASRTTNSLATTFGPSVPLVDLADTALVVATNGAGNVSVTVPARSSRILVRRTGPVRLDPHVLAQSPAHDARTVPVLSPIRLVFNEPMDTIAVMAGLEVTPMVFGRFGWSADRRVMTLQPLEAMAPGTTYRVRLPVEARDAGGRPLRAAFETFWRTGAGQAGTITVPEGYAVEVVAQEGLGAPEGLAFGPGTNGWSTDLYVGDETMDRIVRIGAAGSQAVLASSATLCRKPEGLAFDRAGQYGNTLLTADENQYVQTTSAGTPSAFGTTTASASVGTIAVAPAGPFLGRAFGSSNDNDRIERIETNGTRTVFATGIGGPEGLAFGPATGGWTGDLYVADASLTAYAASINGVGGVWRVAADGTKSLFKADPALAGASALAFDLGGDFGGALYVMDIVNERVLAVTPAGAVSVFATGFGNLFASGGLAFGPDGSFYVADTGSGQPFTDSSGGTAPGRVIRIVRLDTTGVPAAPPVDRLAAAPNPFASSTRLELALAVPGRVRLDIHDVQGRRVATLVDGWRESGAHTVAWDGRDAEGAGVPPGVYFARLVAGGAGRTVKLVRLR